jgi:hypothetical protein
VSEYGDLGPCEGLARTHSVMDGATDTQTAPFLVAKLEALAHTPDTDVAIEFERLPAAVVELFGLGDPAAKGGGAHSARGSGPRELDALATTPTNLEDSRVPRSLLDQLLPFQREGVSFALKRKGRVLIADDMGLGKTLQGAQPSTTVWRLSVCLPVCLSMHMYAYVCVCTCVCVYICVCVCVCVCLAEAPTGWGTGQPSVSRAFT